MQPMYSRKAALIPADDLAAIQECQDLSAPFQGDPAGSKEMYNNVREHRGRLLDHIRALERAPHIGCFCPHCNPQPSN